MHSSYLDFYIVTGASGKNPQPVARCQNLEAARYVMKQLTQLAPALRLAIVGGDSVPRPMVLRWEEDLRYTLVNLPQPQVV